MRGFNQQLELQSKADDTLLTPVDMELEQFLIEQITAAYPAHRLISEESYPSGDVSGEKAASSPYTWAIGPLDGTTAFVHGLPGWGISLGLLREGRAIFGLFYMPLLDDITYTVRRGIRWNGQRLAQTVRLDWNHKGFLAVSTGAHRDFEIEVPRTRALGSVGASLVYTARGSATAALIPKAYLWDLAAGAIILTQAGGELRYLSGRPVDFRELLDGRPAPEPILAGHPALLDKLHEEIQERK
jgi:myo-inositol-1(or 4)-monophosphatase